MSTSSSSRRKSPSDTDLERALRDTVGRICNSGSLEELTVKRVRARVEQELSLTEDFFKQTRWKDRSKAIIEEEADKYNQSEPIPSIESAQSAEVASPDKTTASSSTKAKAASKKRKTPDNPKEATENAGRQKAKRPRNYATVISDEDEDEEEDGTRPRSSSSMARTTGTRTPGSSAKKPNTKPTAKSSSTATTRKLDDLSDSDLSEVIDDAPASKRKAPTQTSKAPTTSKKSAKSTKSKAVDPEAEEIKTLQRRLVECGIRKVWGKELKPYETSLEKIKHLKKMLIDVGMTGRYSKEKAASIREARELAADLEAVQEGAKLWGTDEKDSQRRVNKSVRNDVMDFLDDDMMED